MATTIRPELSEKNPYWIEKHRYYELKHFCLQYPIWRKAYVSLNGFNVCLYSLVDRIMKCIEHCATAKAYSKFREAGAMPTMHDVSLGISEEKNGEKRLN